MFETVASYETPMEAQIVCALLESAGLSVFLGELNLVTANWPISQAVGGVKVRVAREDVAEARRLIAAYHAGELIDGGDADDDRCGACGSAELGIEIPAAQKALALTVFALSGAPISTRARRVCKSCGAVETA